MKFSLVTTSDRASYILQNLKVDEAKITITYEKNGLFNVIIESTFSESYIALRLFHIGIDFGAQTTKDALTKPSNLVKDDILNLQYD